MLKEKVAINMGEKQGIDVCTEKQRGEYFIRTETFNLEQPTRAQEGSRYVILLFL
jgi:hypothetical protein